MPRCVILLIAALTVAAWNYRLTAQTVVIPELGYVFPPIHRGGETVDLMLGLYDPTADLQFFLFADAGNASLELRGPAGRLLMHGAPFFSGPKGYRPLPMPRERPARLQLPVVSENRVLRMQIANANGASRIHRFLISPQRPVHEVPDNTGLPQRLPALPTTVLGCLTRHEEVDRYTFQTNATCPVTVELMARQLGSPFHGLLEVRDLEGTLLADVAATTGLDPTLTFAGQANRLYTVSVRDLDFHGHRSFVYGLEIQPGPRVIATNPLVGCRGTERRVRFIGYGLQTSGMKLESVVRTVQFPNDPEMADFQFPLKTEFGETSHRIPLDNVEQESHLTLTVDGFKPIRSNIGITNAFERDTDEHVYSFHPENESYWTLRATARAFGSPVDLALSIRDPKGKTIVENDDVPGTTDAAIHFQAPSAGPFRVAVRNLSGQRGPSAYYHLEIRRTRPGFRLQLQSQQVQVPVGGKTEMELQVQRRGGFRDAIRVEIEGAPDDVVFQQGNPIEIAAGSDSLKVVVECGPESASHAAMITFTATALVDGAQIRQPVWAPDDSNLAAQQPEFTSSVMLVRTLKPRIKIKPEESDERTVHRGSTHLGGVLFERLEGYQDEVLVTLSGSQEAKFRQGFGGPDVLLPAGASHLYFPCFLPEWLETLDAYRGRLNAVATVRDHQGHLRQLVTRFPPNTSFGITIEGALLRLSHREGTLTIPSGESFTLPLRVSRSPKLTVPVHLQLIAPTHLNHLVSAQSVTVSAGQSSAVLHVQTLRVSGLRGNHKFSVRAISSEHSTLFPTIVDAGVSPLDPQLIELMKRGQSPVMAETQFQVHFVETAGTGSQQQPAKQVSILPRDP